MDLSVAQRERVEVDCKYCGTTNRTFAVCDMFICTGCGKKNRIVVAAPVDGRVVSPPQGVASPL